MSYMGPVDTLDSIAIQPRDRRFSRENLATRWWLGGDPIATAFYNAMSASFPRGEAFFIETLTLFKPDVEPRLAAEIDAFIKQEAIHAREHLALNRRVDQSGYDMAPLEAQLNRRIALLRQKPSIAWLAATMGLEHMTAVFAHHALSDPRHLRKADSELADMWRWHCAEEIEHKGVAFDVWCHVTRDWSRWKRWRVRNQTMVLVTRRFLVDRLRGMIELLRQDGLTGPRVWMAAAWFTCVRPGMVRFIVQGWFQFFKPGFHPWHHDDRHLIERGSDPWRDDAAHRCR